MTVFVYVDTSKEVGDPDHIKVFATADAAATGSKKTIPRAWPLNMRSWSETRSTWGPITVCVRSQTIISLPSRGHAHRALP